jgi:anti-sigma factor RsiW
MSWCHEFLKGFCDYLDSALPPSARDQCDRHVEECARCRVLLETTRKTIAFFRTKWVAVIPPELEQRLMTSIETRACARKN